MPFTFTHSVSNAAHRGLGVARLLFGFSRDHYIIKRRQAGLDLKIKLKDQQTPVLCPLCGFALAYLELNDQWLMESCSAIGFKDAQRTNPAFERWTGNLAGGDSARSKTLLQSEQTDEPTFSEKSYTSPR